MKNRGTQALGGETQNVSGGKKSEKAVKEQKRGALRGQAPTGAVNSFYVQSIVMNGGAKRQKACAGRKCFGEGEKKYTRELGVVAYRIGV